MAIRSHIILSLAAALAAPLASAANVVHSEPVLPGHWRHAQESVSDDEPVVLNLALKPGRKDELLQAVRRVSDPKSPAYGQYLSRSEVEALTAPSDADIMTVEFWLTTEHVPFVRNGRDLKIELTAGRAAQLLNTKFRHVADDAAGQRAVRAGDYVLPEAIDTVVAGVYGMHGLPLPPRTPVMSGSEPATVTPDVIETKYKVSGVTPSGSTKNTQAVAEFQGQTMKPSDLTTFFSKYVKGASADDAKIYKFVGDAGTGTGGVEASLDVDYIMGVAPGVKTEFWYWANFDFCGDVKTWTGTILSSDAPPLVHSVSYGWQGNLTQLGCTDSVVSDIDTNFASLAARGISIIIASGDSGSGYTPSSTGKAQIWPSWPASSPYVTAVGATRFIDQDVTKAEMATDQFGSGGGFSTMFDAFQDQASAVAAYLASAPDLPPAGSYPAKGRATPDVSGLGEGFQVVTNGGTESVGGTSASTPLFAGLVSLLNEERLKAGKPAMGYLNPFLYANPDAFTDVTVGTNAIGRGGQTLEWGFKCTKGWDAATGLGTPDFGALLKAAMAATQVTEDIIV